MSTRSSRSRGALFLLSLPLMAGLVVLAQALEGGRLALLVQPAAALVVFGGTLAAVAFSFPPSLLGRTWRALRRAFGAPPESEEVLLARMGEYATRARASGALSLEADADGIEDPFLSRALSLVVDGASPADVRHTLKAFSQAREEADAECAHVLEAASGYAPTLGILGAVLGLMQAMEHLAAPAEVGPAIAVAFVATIYGVGSANLIFLPLATRLRGMGRAAAISRDLVIEGAVAIQQGLHPRLVDGHLRSLLSAWHPATPRRSPRRAVVRH
ncbi:MAG: motility protein A [Vicinamibacterales bacterium]